MTVLSPDQSQLVRPDAILLEVRGGARRKTEIP